MKRTISTAVLILGLAAPAWAGWDDGLVAAKREPGNVVEQSIFHRLNAGAALDDGGRFGQQFTHFGSRAHNQEVGFLRPACRSCNSFHRVFATNFTEPGPGANATPVLLS